eukprot:GHVO01005565.1.p1 GENE.GHVO01005565.1~~GHVO01005565.1.p1  ORF type:complete len:572 (-),score=181.52 GHVO01005565.1:483-2198(-)
MTGHKYTTENIKNMFYDLRILSKKDLSELIKWRYRLTKEQQEIAEAEADKKIPVISPLTEEERTENEMRSILKKVESDDKRKSKKQRERNLKAEMRKKASLAVCPEETESRDLFKLKDIKGKHEDDDEEIRRLEERFLGSDISSTDSGDSEGEEIEGDEEEAERLRELEQESTAYYDRIREEHISRGMKRNSQKKETRRQRVVSEWAKELDTLNDDIQLRSRVEMAKRRFEEEALSDDDVPNDDVPNDDDAPADLPAEILEGDAGGRDASISERWFSNPIFAGVDVSAVKKGRVSEPPPKEHMIELADNQLPRLPLSEKQKRKEKRKQELEKNQGKPIDDDEDGKGRKHTIEIVPSPPDVHPIDDDNEEDDEGVTVSKPKSLDEIAEIQALGALAIRKKTRFDLIDGAFNRYTYQDDEGALPEWFEDDEKRHNTPEMPVSKELVKEYRQKLKEIEARPIRRVLEAKARKKKRAVKRLDKARQKAEKIAESVELDEASKAKSIRQLVRKATRENQGAKEKVYLVSRSAGGSKAQQLKSGRKINTKSCKNVKVVDKRLKKDSRNIKTKNKKRK